MTGPEAHQTAKEFAERAWPDSEVLIAIHIDADHVHTHFLVNAVCFQTGKMLRQGPNTLKRLRKLSDEICAQHHLSVLPPEAAEVLGISRARAYELVRSRDFLSLKIGSRIAIPKDKLIKWIDEQCTVSG